MKTLKVICTALVLTLVFSVPAYAGDISTPGVKSSSPITTSAAGETEFTSSQFYSADFFEFLLTLVF